MKRSAGCRRHRHYGAPHIPPRTHAGSKTPTPVPRAHPPRTVNRDDLVQIGILLDNIPRPTTDKKCDVRRWIMLAQRVQCWGGQNDVANMIQTGYDHAPRRKRPERGVLLLAAEPYDSPGCMRRRIQSAESQVPTPTSTVGRNHGVVPTNANRSSANVPR